MSDQTLEERLLSGFRHMCHVWNVSPKMEEEFETEWLVPIADEVGALEREHHIMTGMTIETAGAGIVESQEATIAKLEAMMREKRPWDCPDCGPMVKVDEDGCCVHCGREAARKTLEDTDG